MRQKNRDEFIKVVTEGLDEPPQYFAINARFNKEGYESLDKVLKQGLRALSVEEFKSRMNEEDMVVLDTRNEDDFALGFIPDYIFIGLEEDCNGQATCPFHNDGTGC